MRLKAVDTELSALLARLSQVRASVDRVRGGQRKIMLDRADAAKVQLSLLQRHVQEEIKVIGRRLK